MKSLQKITVNPANAILLIVDMQNKFCRPEGRWFTATSARVIPGVITAVGTLVARVRKAGIPVIYIQSVRHAEEPRLAVSGLEPRFEESAWESEIIEEIKPANGDIVIRKSSHDPFYQTELDRVLAGLVDEPARYHALVTGGAINVCAYHTVLGFHLRHYWTVVPVDALYYSLENGQELALEMLSWRAYGNVFFSRTDLIEVSGIPDKSCPMLVPGS